MGFASKSNRRFIRAGGVLATFVVFGVCSRPAVPPPPEVHPTMGGAPSPPPRLLRGQVTDSAGQPLAQARVLAWPQALGPEETHVREGRTGEDGSFELPSLPPGPWTLLTEAPGFGTAQINVADAAGEKVRIQLPGTAHHLRGVVEDGHGVPVPGVAVRLGGPNVAVARQTRSDGQGSFTFAGIGMGRVTVRAFTPGRASRPVAVTVEESSASLPPLRLVLEVGTELSGRVRDPAGMPLVGATVEMFAVVGDDLAEQTMTDGLGRFAFDPVVPGFHRLFVRAAAYVQGTREVRLTPGVERDITVVLARAAELVGRVLDVHGHPLAGAVVSVVGLLSGTDDLTVIPGNVPLAAEAAGLPPAQVERKGHSRAALSAEDGRFRIGDLNPGRARVEVTHKGQGGLRNERVTLAAGESINLGDLVLTGAPPAHAPE